LLRSARNDKKGVIARLSPSRHCEARSAEAISGSDRPYDEPVGPKGSSLSLRPLRLLRSARNDKKGAIAGLPFLVIARLSPFRHCEARSAEAISGSDRPYDEAVGPKGSSLSLRPLRLLRFARNDKKGVIAGLPFWFIPRESYSRHCEAFPLSSLRGFSPLVIARHEVPKQSRVPIGHTMNPSGRKDPASHSDPSDCFAPLAMTRRGPLRAFSSGSSRGNRILVIARLSPSRHCEARSAEAIPGSDRPYDEGLGPKGSTLSVRPLRLLRFARNDKKGVIAGPSLLVHPEGILFSSLRGFPPFVIARHEVPKQSRAPIGHTMNPSGPKDPASHSDPQIASLRSQ